MFESRFEKNDLDIFLVQTFYVRFGFGVWGFQKCETNKGGSYNNVAKTTFGRYEICFDRVLSYFGEVFFICYFMEQFFNQKDIALKRLYRFSVLFFVIFPILFKYFELEKREKLDKNKNIDSKTHIKILVKKLNEDGGGKIYKRQQQLQQQQQQQL